MYLSSISILFFATIMLVGISAMPPSYQTDDDQKNSKIDDAEMQQIVTRPEKFASWLYKRNSPLCDYRLQFRPLPLTAALCAYGHNNKEDGTSQMNPFKYG